MASEMSTIVWTKPTSHSLSLVWSRMAPNSVTRQEHAAKARDTGESDQVETASWRCE